MSWFTDKIKERYTSSGGLDLGNIAKDIGVAGALYGIINPNDSSGLASFFGTGGRQQPVGYTGGIPNYMASREVAPNAFAQTYTTPTGEVAPRRPGAAGRRYFTDTTFTQDTGTPFMGITAEQIAAQNQAAQDERDLFDLLLGSAATQRTEQEAATAAEQAAATAAAQKATTDTTGTATTDTTGGTTGTTGAAGTTSITYTGDNLDTLVALPTQGPFNIQSDERVYNEDLAQLPRTNLSESDRETLRGLIGTGTISLEEAARYFDAINPQGTIMRDKISAILNPATTTSTTTEDAVDRVGNLAELADEAGISEIDLINNLLRGGTNTPEEIVEYYQGAKPEFDEPELITILLDQGKTTPEEVAAYYKDHPVYGGITPEQVVQEFRARGGTRFAQGGNVNGYYLGGTTDGMADQIPATIDNMQPAALSDGEFVIPADVVSHLGNGNSDAGAKNLYSMMERVRKDRTGNPEQGRQIDPNKYLA